MNHPVQPPTRPASYTRTAVSLHWLLALLLLTAFTMGLVMTSMEFSPTRLKMYNWHKWLGVTILALVMARLAWRLSHKPPPAVPMPRWQHLLANGTHWLLYIVMVALPMSGWFFSNASGYPLVYLGKIPLPDLVAKNKPLADFFVQVHVCLAWLFISLVLLHAAAALKHHFLDRDDTLRRMLRWRRP